MMCRVASDVRASTPRSRHAGKSALPGDPNFGCLGVRTWEAARKMRQHSGLLTEDDLREAARWFRDGIIDDGRHLTFAVGLDILLDGIEVRISPCTAARQRQHSRPGQTFAVPATQPMITPTVEFGTLRLPRGNARTCGFQRIRRINKRRNSHLHPYSNF